VDHLRGSREALTDALAGNQQLLRQITQLMDAAAAVQRQLDERGAEIDRLRRASAAGTADGAGGVGAVALSMASSTQLQPAGGSAVLAVTAGESHGGGCAPIWDVEAAAAAAADGQWGTVDGSSSNAAQESLALMRDLSMRGREVEQLTAALGETHTELAAARKVRLLYARILLVCA